MNDNDEDVVMEDMHPLANYFIFISYFTGNHLQAKILQKKKCSLHQ